MPTQNSDNEYEDVVTPPRRSVPKQVDPMRRLRSVIGGVVRQGNGEVFKAVLELGEEVKAVRELVAVAKPKAKAKPTVKPRVKRFWTAKKFMAILFVWSFIYCAGLAYNNRNYGRGVSSVWCESRVLSSLTYARSFFYSGPTWCDVYYDGWFMVEPVARVSPSDVVRVGWTEVLGEVARGVRVFLDNLKD